MMGPVRHSRPPSEPTPGHERERGAALVLMTITISALLVVCTLVIDGSQAYPQRRKAQNAADEAAVAATRALDRWKIAQFEGTSGSDVQATAESVVEDNGAELEACTIISGRDSEIGPCSSAAGDPNAAGVEVEASETRSTSFGDIVERDSITARTSAAATSQPLSETGSPFIVCGNSAVGGRNILNPDNTINVENAKAEGTFAVQGSKEPAKSKPPKPDEVPKCGAGSAFKGKNEADGQVSLEVPSVLPGGNGNGFDHDIYSTVVGATPCSTESDKLNCDILLPIAKSGTGNGEKNIRMEVVAWGVFHVTGDGKGNPKYFATFVGLPSYVTDGGTSDGVPTGDRARVIRLIE